MHPFVCQSSITGVLCRDMKKIIVRVSGWGYRHVGAPFFYLFDSEPIHEFFLWLGDVMGAIPGIPAITRAMYRITNPMLKSEVAGITFEIPVGLAAGFDHEAQMPRIVGALGFGFESVGTVTNGIYGGNPYPRIKRLVKSRAILVNKGFKSTGMSAVVSRLKGQKWDVPIGISIGKTNTVDIDTHEEAIEDVLEGFRKAIRSELPFSYFELNISCPNLLKDISFYDAEHLEQMLKAVCGLKLPKPLFIKMPIGLHDDATKSLLDVIVRYPVAAVIFGNLQRDRTLPIFDKAEIEAHAQFKGNWSGMPCQSESDKLVQLTYRHTHGKLAIIGCGGIFNAEDAYRKIRLGASLVQLVAATIFEGPQIASEICIDLPKLLQKDGYKNISEAVGVDSH